MDPCVGPRRDGLAWTGLCCCGDKVPAHLNGESRDLPGTRLFNPAPRGKCVSAAGINLTPRKCKGSCAYRLTGTRVRASYDPHYPQLARLPGRRSPRDTVVIGWSVQPPFRNKPIGTAVSRKYGR